jgi:single-strand DNA-binding protein
MANLNKVFLIGNLTRDVELRATQSGTNVAKFGMAINHKYTQNGQQKETTCFVDVTAFGRQAEVLAQYLKKGRPVFVEGRLDYSTWEDKEGNKKSKLQVIVENFQFIDGPGGQRGSEEGGRGPARRAESGPGEGEAQGAREEEADSGLSDIPF